MSILPSVVVGRISTKYAIFTVRAFANASCSVVGDGSSVVDGKVIGEVAVAHMKG